MTTDTATTVRPPGFYDSELYVDDLDYMTLEEVEPLPSLDQQLLKQVAKNVIACVATVAALGITIAEAPIATSAVSEPAAVARDAREPDKPADIRLMTQRMRERAGLASRLFARTPHPGADETDPDYGF